MAPASSWCATPLAVLRFLSREAVQHAKDLSRPVWTRLSSADEGTEAHLCASLVCGKHVLLA